MINEQQLRHKIKNLRIQKGLTEAEVATKLGKSGNSYVNRIENGPTKINIEILEELCSFYKVSPLELLQSAPTTPSTTPSQAQRGFFEKRVFRGEDGLEDDVREEIKQVLPTLRKIGKVQKILGKEPVKLEDISPELKDINLKSPFAAQASARKAALAIRKFFKLDQNSSIDVASFCWNNLNIPICGLDLGSNCWGLYSSDKAGNPLIIYSNTHKFFQRNNFTIAHEIGHYLFAHDLLNIDCDATENNIIEKVADTFAQELLVPNVALREVYDDLGLSLVKDIKPHHVTILCEHFRVSFFMMIVVLRQTQKITSTNYNELKEFCLNQLEFESKNLGYQPEKYFNHIKPLNSQLKELVLVALRKELISFFEASQMLDVSTSELQAAL
jgi:Zn-dependent peptidase ImmA (M78 family)/DNA-binding XRE family transcriptional regulator